MTATVSPGMATTRSGAPLPLVALPQDELLTVNIDQIPLLKDLSALASTSSRCAWTPKRGEWSSWPPWRPVLELPIHYHTGTAQVWTIQGRWLYREYPDQPQTPGSYLYEPGGSVHTFFCPEDNTEDTIALVDRRRAGQLQRGRHVPLACDAVTIQYLTETVAAAAGHRAGPLHPRRRRRRGQES